MADAASTPQTTPPPPSPVQEPTSILTGQPPPSTSTPSLTQSPTTPSPTEAHPFFDGIKDAEAREWARKIGLADTESAVRKAYHQEKLIGHDRAGRTIVLPKEGDSQAQAEFFDRLGRPKDISGYEIPLETEAAKTFANKFHEIGITKTQAHELAKVNDALVQANNEAQERAFAQKAQTEVQDLRKEWGQNFEKLADLSNRAAADAGLNDTDIAALNRALGPARAAKIFAHFGQKMQEQPIVGGSRSTNFGVLTPEVARAQIQALTEDKAWVTRYLSKDHMATAEMNRLQQLANPT